jgi:O-antigen/teichoic acid export membrane protein
MAEIETESNKKRIAKNTVFMYLRMFAGMIIGLYTSRVVLHTLGVESYGVYSVVGGVVGMLSFINMSMSAGTQRYMNFYMKDGIKKLNEVFSTGIIIHAVIAIVVSILLESAGLWFVKNKLVVPADQLDAAIWVFHLSVITTAIGIVNTPYSAAIIAHEKMSIYAYFSILELSFKLLIVYLLVVIPGNKLIVYGTLNFFVGLLMRFIYSTYCSHKFKECYFTWIIDWQLIKSMLSFSGWMILGCVAVILISNGTSLIINMFCGPVFNASQSIALTIQGTVVSFVGNIFVSIRPQIVKSYSVGKMDEVSDLIYLSSKLSSILIALFGLPFLIYTREILMLWLGKVPDLVVPFIIFMLIDSYFRYLFAPLGTLNQATGKVKYYQIGISFLFVIQFVISAFLLYLGFPAYTPYAVALVFTLIGLPVRLVTLKNVNGFDIRAYLVKCMLPITISVVIATIISFCLSSMLGKSWIEIIASVAVNSIVIVLFAYWITLTKQERMSVAVIFKKFLRKFKS